MSQREKREIRLARRRPREMRLDAGSRIAVIGCGPAGSLFSYFLLDLSERLGLSLEVDIFEPRYFASPGRQGCNMCGGIISETLVQNLAAEGISLPPGVVQRGIDSYVLHMDVGAVKIDTPLNEMRIGAVHRGIGPRDAREPPAESFDGHLQALALGKGARLVDAAVEEVVYDAGKPTLQTGDGVSRAYDLVVAAVGVNSAVLKIFEGLGIGYQRPRVTRTLIREYRFSEEAISRTVGTSMHVFLLDIPRLEFAALIPKGEYVTMCLLGDDIDPALVDAFVAAPEVKGCMPPGWNPERPSCQCQPYINVRGMAKPFADRFLFIGDCGVTRLYKDGIGAAYRTAKAAARAALFGGVSEAAFRRRYLPVCRTIANDNRIGRLAFLFTRLIRHTRLLRGAVLRMTVCEQSMPRTMRRMSGVLWDMFSGSAPYVDIFKRMLSPAFLGRFLWSVAASAGTGRRHHHRRRSSP
jgi:flavin-dependent dehydrogenase